jgi:rubredoxin
VGLLEGKSVYPFPCVKELHTTERKLEMIPVNSKCPKCEEGIMKLPANPTELSPLVAAPGRVRCTKCGYEDYAEIKPKG